MLAEQRAPAGRVGGARESLSRLLGAGLGAMAADDEPGAGDLRRQSVERVHNDVGTVVIILAAGDCEAQRVEAEQRPFGGELPGSLNERRQEPGIGQDEAAFGATDQAAVDPTGARYAPDVGSGPPGELGGVLLVPSLGDELIAVLDDALQLG